ncbi:MAG: ABC transporter substrate-binding protein [Anaerolineae bacterium]|nr:ABC transporter substrate-binding protein [Anaerolineae bacterium]
MKKTTFLILVLVAALVLPTVGGYQPTRAQDAIEITFVHIFPDERDIRRTTIEEIAAAFMEQNPGVVVNVQSTTDDYGEVFESALRAADQGNAPHVIQVEDSLQQIALDSQFFVKMSDYASADQQATIPDIIEPMRNFYNISEDEFWGLPWNASNPVMYYNPDLFEAAGLDPNAPPTTFDEITAACDALMSANIKSLNGCINWPVNSWLPEQWVSMQNALFVNNDNGRSGRATEALLDSPEMLKIFTWLKDLSDKGYFTYSGTPGAYTPEGLLFITKKTAIHLSTSAGISNILSFAGTMGQFTPMIARFPMPDADATNGVTPGGAAVWVMGGHSEAETQAAVDFVFFLINTDNMSAWHKASGYFPIRQSSIDQLDDEGWFDEHPAFRVPLDQLLDSTPNAANAGATVGAATQIRGAVIDAFLSVVDAGEDPADALSAAKSRADKAIEQYNSVIVD